MARRPGEVSTSGHNSDAGIEMGVDPPEKLFHLHSPPSDCINSNFDPNASIPPSNPAPKLSMYRRVTGVRYESAMDELARATSLI